MAGRKVTAALVREFALALPQTEEREHMGAASFRVRGKIFAQLSADEQVALVKVSLSEQASLVKHDPDRFWTPVHWAKFGWTYVRLDGTGSAELRALVEQSWRRIAPKNLASAQAASAIELTQNFDHQHPRVEERERKRK